MKNNIKTTSIILSVLFMCSYNSKLLSSEKNTSEQKSDNNRLTPLHVATTENQVNAVLNNYPEYLNAPDRNGLTPIQYMIKNGNISAAIAIKERGANMNRQDQITYINMLKKECIYKTRK